MTIYRVNRWNEKEVYFDELKNINAKSDAIQLLKDMQNQALNEQGNRFSICIVVINGTDTTWRKFEDSDIENATYQVFNNKTGKYDEVYSKSDAKKLNEERIQEFFKEIGIDQIYEVDSIPEETQPNIWGVNSLPTN